MEVPLRSGSAGTPSGRPISGMSEDEYSVPAGTITVEPPAPGTPSALAQEGATEEKVSSPAAAAEGPSLSSTANIDEPASVSELDGDAASPSASAKKRQVGFNETLGSAIHMHPDFPARIEDPSSANSVVSGESPFDVSVEEEAAAAAADANTGVGGAAAVDNDFALMSLGLADESSILKQDT